MLVLLSSMILAQTEFRPLVNCALIRSITFYEDMSALPSEIRLDIQKRVGFIYPRSERGLNFSDAIGPRSKVGRQLLYVAREEDQWLISYMYGGIAIKTVTVSYLLSGSKLATKPYLMGALEGDGCTAANAFLKGISVEPSWQH